MGPCLPPQDEEEAALVAAKMDDARTVLHIEALFLFSLVWSMGATGAGIQVRLLDFHEMFESLEFQPACQHPGALGCACAPPWLKNQLRLGKCSACTRKAWSYMPEFSGKPVISFALNHHRRPAATANQPQARADFDAFIRHAAAGTLAEYKSPSGEM